MDKRPAVLGYRMPAEWEKHEATWLAWPHNEETWPGKRLGIVRDIYLQMLEGLLPGEKVKLLVKDKAERDEVTGFLKPKLDLKNLIFFEVPAVDSWIRDYGPTYIKNGSEKSYVKWIFNAWGGKYESLMEDTKIFVPGNKLVSEPCFDSGIVLEGGSIEVNGAGTCLTSEQCLLNPNRNPQLSRPKIEQLLRDYLGVSQILWMHEGIVGDDTDGHIDDIVRFTDASTVLCTYEEDGSDENFPLLHENWERLQRSSDANGKKWNLVKLPMPGRVEDGGVRLPASYANFLIANKAVLLPVYSHKNDGRAAKILKELFPKHEILPIECTAMVYGLGAIHCVSQQEPA
jgi:agmatine deiminase